MQYYAVIDTNVVVSAMLKWNSVPGNVLELTFGGTIIPVLNAEIVQEYRAVLSRAKFHFTQEIVEGVVGELERLGKMVDAEALMISSRIPRIACSMKSLWKNASRKMPIWSRAISSISRKKRLL